MRILQTTGRSLYIAFVVLPFALGALGYWLIVLVDPYSVRPFSLISPRLGEHRYPDGEWPKLISTIARQPHDVVLLGGSTTMAIDTEMMRAAYPGSRNPINLSYIAPRPLDFSAVMQQAAGIQGLKRIVLVMDFTLLERRQLRSDAGQAIHDISFASWSRGSDFSPRTALASLHRLLLGTFDLPQWWRLNKPEFMLGAGPITNSDAILQRYSGSVARHRTDVFERTTLTCNQIPYVSEVLEPFLKKMAKNDVHLDLIFPPVPYVFYYDWIDNAPGSIFFYDSPCLISLWYSKNASLQRKRVREKRIPVLSLLIPAMQFPASYGIIWIAFICLTRTFTAS